jgi:hypothetical protein
LWENEGKVAKKAKLWIPVGRIGGRMLFKTIKNNKVRCWVRKKHDFPATPIPILGHLSIPGVHSRWKHMTRCPRAKAKQSTAQFWRSRDNCRIFTIPCFVWCWRSCSVSGCEDYTRTNQL